MLLLTTSFLFASSIALDTLNTPDNFTISLFASEVTSARQMALGSNGTVFVGSRNEGKVYALVDIDKDGKADKQYLIAEDLDMPSGVAFHQGSLYVAAVKQVLRYDNIESQLHKPPKPVFIINNLPDDAHHGWKAIEISGDSLFIPVGVPCNICIGNDQRHGTILEYSLKTGKTRIYARGVRNSVGLAFHPLDNSLWFTDNGRDWMGDHLPPDEINHATKQGLHFGFPYLHGRSVLDPEYGEFAESDNYTLPVIELGAHVAPLGLAFYTGNQFPGNYKHGLFVAEHGSWNRSEKTGYRVIFIPFKNNRATKVEAFITGWLNREQDKTWGRPVDILNLPDGSILISDDYADAVYRVTYNQQTKTGSQSK